MMASRWPKGGLPTLKRDLLKLAALLHVKVDDKATIKDLRTELGPAAADVCGKIGYAKAVEHVAPKTSGYGADLDRNTLSESFGRSNYVLRPNRVVAGASLRSGQKPTLR